ncbi:MAG: hypothetical protein F4Z96_02625 [Chloroflexi bacterium]|nr:hypothetical protein [Chloroflexota bacterium]
MPTNKEVTDASLLLVEAVAQWIMVQVRPDSIRDLMASLRAEVEEVPTESDAAAYGKRAYALYLVDELERQLTRFEVL